MTSDERERGDVLGERVRQHARDCDECRTAPLPVEAIVAVLGTDRVAIDAGALSRRVLAALRPELARLASQWFWRRLGRGVLAALVPLPLVLLFDAWVLSSLHEWAATVLPDALVTWVLASYGALLLLLFASTYAAIPLVLARAAWERSVVGAEAVS